MLLSTDPAGVSPPCIYAHGSTRWYGGFDLYPSGCDFQKWWRGTKEPSVRAAAERHVSLVSSVFSLAHHESGRSAKVNPYKSSRYPTLQAESIAESGTFAKDESGRVSGDDLPRPQRQDPLKSRKSQNDEDYVCLGTSCLFQRKRPIMGAGDMDFPMHVVGPLWNVWRWGRR